MKKKNIIIIFVIVLVVGIAVFAGKSMYDQSKLDDSREGALKTIENVDVSVYRAEERKEVEKLTDKTVKEIETAESQDEINKFMDDFWKALDAVDTADEKLDICKKNAEDEIQNWKIKGYTSEGAAKIKQLQKSYLKKVNAAAKEDDVKKALKKFKQDVRAVKTKKEIEAEQEAAKLQQQKEEREKAQQSAQTQAQAQTAKPTKSAASKYVGKDVSQMIAAIGAPVSKSYASSCLGAGDDGVLRYNGFTVYTYRENGKETVQSVE